MRVNKTAFNLNSAGSSARPPCPRAGSSPILYSSSASRAWQRLLSSHIFFPAAPRAGTCTAPNWPWPFFVNPAASGPCGECGSIGAHLWRRLASHEFERIRLDLVQLACEKWQVGLLSRFRRRRSTQEGRGRRSLGDAVRIRTRAR
jgi:hypothetical protein